MSDRSTAHGDHLYLWFLSEQERSGLLPLLPFLLGTPGEEFLLLQQHVWGKVTWWQGDPEEVGHGHREEQKKEDCREPRTVSADR